MALAEAFGRHLGEAAGASIQCDRASGRYRIKFRFGGVEYQRSTKTPDRRTAEAVKARVEETLCLLTLGRLEVQDGADVAAFVLCYGAGRRRQRPISPELQVASWTAIAESGKGRAASRRPGLRGTYFSSTVTFLIFPVKAFFPSS